MTKLDPRLHAYRPDLADIRLQDDLSASHYVAPRAGVICVPRAPLLENPKPGAKAVSEAIFGDNVAMFEVANGWAWLQTSKDGYVGYVESGKVVYDQAFEPTHQVSVPATFLFSGPDLKSKPVCRLFLNTQLAISSEVENEKWVKFAVPGPEAALTGYIYSKHLRPINETMSDPVSLAKHFIGVPYLWGGGTADGLDCSGFIQQVLVACGYDDCPRDSDMIENWLAGPQKKVAETGDLVFWDGHIGMMISDEDFIHANAFHLSVKVERFADVVERIAEEYQSKPRILALKR